jgi:hypothetical protein
VEIAMSHSLYLNDGNPTLWDTTTHEGRNRQMELMKRFHGIDSLRMITVRRSPHGNPVNSFDVDG